MNKRDRNEYMRGWYAKNKIEVRKKRRDRPSEQKEVRAAYRRTAGAQTATKTYNKRYAESTKGRALRLVLSAKKRALKNKLVFDIGIADVLPALEAGVCQRTGLPFDLTAGGGKRHPFAPSIDQVTAGHGYTKNNIEVVCWIYNVCKSDFLADAVLTFARALSAKHS